MHSNVTLHKPSHKLIPNLSRLLGNAFIQKKSRANGCNAFSKKIHFSPEERLQENVAVSTHVILSCHPNCIIALILVRGTSHWEMHLSILMKPNTKCNLGICMLMGLCARDCLFGMPETLKRRC